MIFNMAPTSGSLLIRRFADPTMRGVLRTALALVTLAVMLPLFERPVAAKVATITLLELAQRAEFIGIVRVDRIGLGIPFVRSPRASATIRESWKGRATGKVTFVAAPTWICDISGADKGEEAVVFLRRGSLEHAGRGRMPIYTRDGRELAAIWPEVRLPPTVITEDGPEPKYDFIRGVTVDSLRQAVDVALSARHDGGPQ